MEVFDLNPAKGASYKQSQAEGPGERPKACEEQLEINLQDGRVGSKEGDLKRDTEVLITCEGSQGILDETRDEKCKTRFPSNV